MQQTLKPTVVPYMAALGPFTCRCRPVWKFASHCDYWSYTFLCGYVTVTRLYPVVFNVLVRPPTSSSYSDTNGQILSLPTT